MNIPAPLLPLARTLARLPPLSWVRRSQGDWRFIYLPMAWAVAGLLTRRRRVTVGNVSITLPCHNWITHFRWYLFASKEVEVRSFIEEYVHDGDVFFDIGANIGVFTLYACKRYPGLKAYSFEPEYSNLHLLKENLLENGLTAQANPISAAVSNFDGLSVLHLQDTTPGAACHSESSSEIEKTYEGFRVVAKEGVCCYRLDTLCNQLGVVPNALKIDTDGNEPKILEGGLQTLANPALRSVSIEMPDGPEDRAYCRKALEEAGFKCVFQRDDTRNQTWVK